MRVHGFPFLTQAVAGDYRDVELAAKPSASASSASSASRRTCTTRASR
ncbi:hypothetical protein [Saccharopolyspora gregorii]